MLWLPMTAAILYALGIAHFKWILGRFTIEFRALLSAQFIFLFLGTVVFVPWFGGVEAQFFAPRNLFLFGFLIVVATVYNLFWTRGLKRESLHEFELIDLLLPIFTIVLAAVTFIDERQPVQLSLAILAAGTFFLTHLRQHHIHLKQADRWLIFAVFLMAIEAILVKPLLELATPVSLYAFRTGLITIVLLLVFRPHFATIPRLAWGHIILNALLGLGKMLLWLMAIQALGIVVTELVMLLTPILLAVASLIYFRERWTALQVVAFMIILVCVGVVHWLGQVS